MDKAEVLHRMRDAFIPSAFAEPASLNHRDIYADAVVELLLDGGTEKVTMASVARSLRQVPSSVSQITGSRKAFLGMVVGRFTGRWARWVAQPDYSGAVRLRLPVADDELHGVRVWSALREIAAGEARAGRPELAKTIAEARPSERLMLLAAFRGRGIEASEVVINALLCLADGLRVAMADPVEPIDLELAHTTAQLVIESLCGTEATAGADLPERLR